jgi:small subunit ribosomal protein S20
LVEISFLVGVLRPTLLQHWIVWGRREREEPPAPHPTRPEPERGFRVANIKSQIKRNKQNEAARQRNKAVKSSLKTAVRKFREAADAGDVDAATVAMRTASQSLDKAASKGVIHKNQAANRKSAMATRCAELSKS